MEYKLGKLSYSTFEKCDRTVSFPKIYLLYVDNMHAKFLC